MLAITAWVWSCGSRLRLATWRNVAAAMNGAFTRGRCRVSGSQPRVSRSVSSTQSSVDRTASSCARTTERSPRGWRSVGSNAASDTDFGAEKVKSNPGRRSYPPCRTRPSRISVPGT